MCEIMVIQSILENDLYKFSMSHYYQVHYPNAWGTFTFCDRNNTRYTASNTPSLPLASTRHLPPEGRTKCGLRSDLASDLKKEMR